MPDDRAIRFLLSSSDPSVRFFTLTEVMGRSARAAEVRALRRAIPAGPRVRALLAGQRSDGGFGVHPYKKWDGAHWRLVSLAELSLPRGHPQALRAAEQVLAWLRGPSHRGGIVTIRGRVRRCASQEGNALRACVHFGLADDPRVRALAEDLAAWQWPDGGWNCDRRPEATHSSFHESLIPLWALIEYRRKTGDDTVEAAIERAVEFFLRHRLFRSERTGRAFIGRQFAYPPYWHYDILTALRVFERLGRLKEPRVQEAIDIVEAGRGRDGLWRADVVYWKRGKTARHRDVVHWGRGSTEILTLNALRVLKAAGR
jgi:hypothetical protein